MKLETLADFITPNLSILSIGLNPSPNSVACGFPFATPQNRFWRALNASRLVDESYPPCLDSMRRLLDIEQIGFTDIVKRPTPGARDLRAGDYRLWAPILAEKIASFRPRLLWFQGKLAYSNFARHVLGLSNVAIAWGVQPGRYAGSPIFVTPNPSAANARYSLADIVESMNALADFSRAGAD